MWELTDPKSGTNAHCVEGMQRCERLMPPRNAANKDGANYGPSFSLGPVFLLSRIGRYTPFRLLIQTERRTDAPSSCWKICGTPSRRNRVEVADELLDWIVKRGFLPQVTGRYQSRVGLLSSSPLSETEGAFWLRHPSLARNSSATEIGTPPLSQRKSYVRI